jgi:hypothetical protein
MKHLYSFNESIVVPPFGDLEDIKHMLLDLQDEGYEVEVEENKPNSAPAFGKIPGSYDILVSSNLWNASPRQQIVRPRQEEIFNRFIKPHIGQLISYMEEKGYFYEFSQINRKTCLNIY